MERAWLERRLQSGQSVESIAKERGLHPSSVYYWVKKHGLRSPYAEKHAPRGPLDEELVRRLVQEGCTVGEIAASTGRGAASVRLWLRRYGLQTERQLTYRPDVELPDELLRRCRHHGRTRFVRVGEKNHYRCAACTAKRVSERRRRVKRILVEEAGGRCAICGYDRYVGALQFHHLNPGEKAFIVSLRGATRGIAKLRAEARKCVLLCANCHAEVEAGMAEVGAVAS
jgi:transposase-like protein